MLSLIEKAENLEFEKAAELRDRINQLKEMSEKWKIPLQKEAEFLLDDLNSYLSDIFDILEVFSKYKLIYTTGNFEKSGKKQQNPG